MKSFLEVGYMTATHYLCALMKIFLALTGESIYEIIRRIAEVGKDQWKKEVSYHSRSLVETAFFRYKTIFGNKMLSRIIENQKVEALINCNLLNAFTCLGMPESYPVG